MCREVARAGGGRGGALLRHTDEDDAVVGARVHAVELDEEFGLEAARGLVLVGVARAQHAVHLVHEDDTRLKGDGHRKEGTDEFLALAHLRAKGVEESNKTDTPWRLVEQTGRAHAPPSGGEPGMRGHLWS